MNQTKEFSKAIRLFDEANSQDPTSELHEGKEYPKELLYAIRMTEKLQEFEPKAEEALGLAVRCQHLRRWEIPRSQYDMNRVGYLKWRNDLKSFHAEKASEILKQSGYESDLIDQVRFLLLKKQLKKNKMTQTLEDVICLVFLEFYFEKFSHKYQEEKLIDIVKKTWTKMSDKGQKAALGLPLSDRSLKLISQALS